MRKLHVQKRRQSYVDDEKHKYGCDDEIHFVDIRMFGRRGGYSPRDITAACHVAVPLVESNTEGDGECQVEG